MTDKIGDSEITLLREQFKKYLNDNYAHLKDKSVIRSNTFFPYRHGIGMNFWDIFVDENSLGKARELLEINFKERSRKNPKGDSCIYKRALNMFKDFLDSTYGGVSRYLEFVKTNQHSQVEHVNISKGVTTTLKKKTLRPDVPRPCCEEIAKYLLAWDQLENYALQESALDKLFFRTYPDNKDIDDVLIKVSALNDFYSTNIFSPFKIAKHIIKLGIDERLVLGDVTLVNDIARVDMGNGTVRNFYSFATKYCSHHKHLDYPIYDSYVDRLLRYFRDVDRFYKFGNDDLKEYMKFKNILLEFSNFYDLAPYTLKDIDKYLWQLGKEKFPRKY